MNKRFIIVVSPSEQEKNQQVILENKIISYLFQRQPVQEKEK